MNCSETSTSYSSYKIQSWWSQSESDLKWKSKEVIDGETSNDDDGDELACVKWNDDKGDWFRALFAGRLGVWPPARNAWSPA